jgi:hypothetical protein
MHSVHDGLSIVVPIRPDRADCLSAILEEINCDPANNAVIPFGKSPTTLFASGVTVPEQPYGYEKLPSNFMFFTSFSGPLSDHISEIINLAHHGLCRIFQHCYNFPDYCFRNPEMLRRFLIKYNHAHTFYSGIHHITPADIKGEEDLRKEIKRYVDKNQRDGVFDNQSPGTIKRMIASFIATQKDFAWAQNPYTPSLADYSKRYNIPQFAAIAAVALLAQRLPAPFRKFIPHSLLLLLILFFIMVMYIESHQTKRISTPPSDKRLEPIMATQCNLLLNELTAANSLKPGRVRRFMFRLMLRVVSLFSGILNIPTVATARWLATDKGKRLVFISNYAHPAESYVRDFVNSGSSARGINLLFGHGEGFPGTKGLFLKGTQSDPEGFMNAMRTALQPRRFWYCPYPNLSVDNINNNRKIRDGLFKLMTNSESQDWLDQI